jgi:ubiquinone/menaquinone biosynthesis C-methylase UbiE
VKTKLIASQSSHPRGLLGEIVARVMAVETAPVNRRAIELLGVKPGEAVLELGCGHGHTLAAIATQNPGSFTAGVDPSKLMLRLARRRLRKQLRAGRAELDLGSAGELRHADGRFDAALAVHVLYFWLTPRTELAEIRRVLRPEGRLLLAYRPKDDPGALEELPASVYSLRSVPELEALCHEAGFSRVQTVLEAGSRMSMAYTTATVSAA